MSLFEPVLRALTEANTRFVVVGGVAVVLHGYGRLTVDLDLIIDLEEAAARDSIRILEGEGFVPRVPVDAEDFADPAVRERWIREKNMQVFSMVDPRNPMRVVDLFVENPVDFEDLWERGVPVELETTTVRIASIPDLIHLKKRAGRPEDLRDIEALLEIQRATTASDQAQTDE